MHLSRFQKSVIAVPVSFFVGLFVAWIAADVVRLTFVDALMIAWVFTAVAGCLPLLLFAFSVMRGVDILETLRAGTPPRKQ